MTERKVLNKYFPPDYDPSKIPRLPRGKKNRVFNLRTMAPFNMRCLTCKTYIYKARKFNSRMEPVDSEDYLGLRIYRFYIRCPACCSEISWKTDIANNDYVIESGTLRTFEATRTAYKMAIEKDAQVAEDEKNNPMLLLENRTKQSKREMDQLEILEDLRDMNMKHASLDIPDRALEQLHKQKKKSVEEEERELQAELDRLVEQQAEKQKEERTKNESMKVPIISKQTLAVKSRKRQNPLANLKSSIIVKKRVTAPVDTLMPQPSGEQKKGDVSGSGEQKKDDTQGTGKQKDDIQGTGKQKDDIPGTGEQKKDVTVGASDVSKTNGLSGLIAYDSSDDSSD